MSRTGVVTGPASHPTSHAHPARRVALTATAIALIGLHLIAAAVMIPSLARSLVGRI